MHIGDAVKIRTEDIPADSRDDKTFSRGDKEQSSRTRNIGTNQRR